MEKMTTVPHSIKAKDEVELQLSMLKNNLADGYFYRYFDIQPHNGGWIAWYYKDIEKTAVLKGAENGSDDRG